MRVTFTASLVWFVAVAPLLWVGCDLGSTERGTFSTSFSWSDEPPLNETWVHARVEQADGESRVQIAEAPLARRVADMVLHFPSVPHGGPYRVVVELKAEPSKRARTLYFGESAPFALRAGEHTDVDVALLMTAPIVADADDPSGAVRVVGKNERGYVRQHLVSLSLAPVGATRVIAANDFALTAGRRELSLAALEREDGRYLVDWDLDQGLCARPPCPDGTRFVFVQFLNEQGYPSEVASARVDLDRVAPQVAASSLSPSPARVGSTVSIVLNPSEPLAGAPQLYVEPRDPGIGPFIRSAGGGYVAEYVVPPSEQHREQLGFSVELIDRAGHRSTVALAQQLVIDSQPPALLWGPDVMPPVVRDGQSFALRFELNEVPAGSPVVRVGGTAVDCVFEGSSRRGVACQHVARRSEGGGELAIAIEVQDEAGNLATLTAGSVIYDTVPRCGDGVVAVDQLEVCDDGTRNSEAPDAACRPDCRPRRCGDAIVDPQQGEVCDDGNNADTDGCSADCRSLERCGNALWEPHVGEACDDGNLLSHDGCSSACDVEELVALAYAPQPSRASASAYNVDDEQVLVVGDKTAYALGDRGWLPISKPLGSTISRVTSMVYHADRGQPLVWDGGTAYVLEGTDWKEAVGPDWRAPSGRDLPGLAYIGSRRQTLLFGGSSPGLGADDYYTDLWAWDGSYWDELVPADAVAPPAGRSAIAYDPRRDRIVVLVRDDGALFETWEWDGARWHPMDSARTFPTSPREYRLLYDPLRERVVVRFAPHVWEWDGVRWEPRETRNQPDAVYAVDLRRSEHLAIGMSTRLETEGGAAPELFQQPSPRLGTAATWETQRLRAVKFGGYESSAMSGKRATETYDGSTWVWSRHSWTPLTVASDSPSPRAFAAMAHDPVRGVSVLFGGQVGVGQPCAGACQRLSLLDDTWELAGDRWQRVALEGESPPPGPSAEMFFDIAHRRMTLFAATDAGTLGVWHLQDGAWRRAAVSGDLPRARTHYSLVYDPVRQRAVLFGGEFLESGVTVPLGDTWAWDGTRFEALKPAGAPSGRSGQGAAYDAARGSVVIYGGVTRDGEVHDIHEWDGVRWHGPSSLRELPSVEHHGMFFDTITQTMVSVGGSSGSTGRSVAAWTRLARFEDVAGECDEASSCPPGRVPEEVCLPGRDGDGDSLLGCADPDCYARCFASCNPVFGSCEAYPSCGDDACDGFEDCHSCPADCGPCAPLCGDNTCQAGEGQLSCPGDCTP